MLKEFVKILAKSFLYAPKEIRERLGKDVEELLASLENNDSLPKFLGVDHGGRTQALMSLPYWDINIHGIGKFPDFDPTAPNPQVVEDIERLARHVYMGTLEMDSNTGQYHQRHLDRIVTNPYSSTRDLKRETRVLFIVDDMVNPGPTTAVSALEQILTGDYADRFNAEKVGVIAIADWSVRGFPNASGSRFLYDPKTFELLFPSDKIPAGPVEYLSDPQLAYFHDRIFPRYGNRILTAVSSRRNDINSLFEEVQILRDKSRYK